MEGDDTDLLDMMRFSAEGHWSLEGSGWRGQGLPLDDLVAVSYNLKDVPLVGYVWILLLPSTVPDSAAKLLMSNRFSKG